MSALAGKVALVTGSSRGIGAGIARLFAAEGARVALHGRDRAALARVASEIGGTAHAFTADLTRFQEIEAMREAIERELGAVDILIANAGGSHEGPRPLEEATEEGFRSSIENNLTSMFLTLKSFVPGMKQRRSGSIVTISSAAARRAHERSPLAYTAAKAGVEIMTQQLALQAGPFNVRANCIAPETILTERNQERIPEAQKPALADSHPLKRLGTPEDVARAALFLAADSANWITGIVLDVAGGAVMPR